MKKVLIVLVVAAAIVALFFVTKKTTQAPSNTDVNDNIETGVPTATDDTPTEDVSNDSTEETPLAEVTVAFGPKGFDPKSVTIKSGQTVTFINESESSMWIASAMHPVHAAYPEKTDKDCLGSAFDQCVAVGIGESFSFKFTQKGSWGYHNHVAPNNWGTIVVE